MKPGLKLKQTFGAFGLRVNKVSERLIQAGHCIDKHSIYETIEEQDNRTKVAKLARAMSIQKDKVNREILWNLFYTA